MTGSVRYDEERVAASFEKHGHLTALDLLRHLRPGETWRNVHTDTETTILDFNAEDDYGIGCQGSVRVRGGVLVDHEANRPPGPSRPGGHRGQALASFLEHWRPA